MALNISLQSLLEDNETTSLTAEEMQYSYSFDFLTEVYFRMKELGINQKELARRLDISESTLSRNLSRDNNFRVSTLAKIAAALGCTLSEPKLIPNEDSITLDSIETSEALGSDVSVKNDDEMHESVSRSFSSESFARIQRLAA